MITSLTTSSGSFSITRKFVAEGVSKLGFQGWFLFGIILVLLEFIVPGAILSFLGIAALSIGVLDYYGLIPSLLHGLTYWFLISLVLVFTIRTLVLMHWMPSESNLEGVDDNDNAIGAMASVVEEIRSDRMGRIRYRETTWGARTDGERCREGDRVLITGRESTIWKVTLAQEED